MFMVWLIMVLGHFVVGYVGCVKMLRFTIIFAMDVVAHPGLVRFRLKTRNLLLLLQRKPSLCKH